MNNKNIIWINLSLVLMVLIIGLSCYYVTNKTEISKETYLEGTVAKIDGRYITLKDKTGEYQIYVKDQYDGSVGDKIKLKANQEGNIYITETIEIIEKITFEPIIDNEVINQEIPNTNINDNIINQKPLEQFTESDVIEYFNNLNSQIDNNTSFKDSLKESFITIVDFFFYNGEIKGYKFKELTNQAKIEVMKIAFKIDTKINEKFPNYKEYISEKYHNFKNEMISLYMETGSLICETNENLCIFVKDSFTEIKSYASIGWDYIKDLFTKGTDKIQLWYEIYSGKQ